MKNVLVIGSTVVDVIIQIDHLPSAQEDVHVQHQHMSLGGCAYNVSDMIRHFGVPYTLFSPVGTGAYGDFVRTQLTRRGVATPIPAPAQENGCCYCFIEADGERPFSLIMARSIGLSGNGFRSRTPRTLTLSTSVALRSKNRPVYTSLNTLKRIRNSESTLVPARAFPKLIRS